MNLTSPMLDTGFYTLSYDQPNFVYGVVKLRSVFGRNSFACWF